MPLNIHRIRLVKGSDLLGTSNRFPDLRRVFREVATDAVDAAADYGLITAKSIVPIDTGELRGTNLDNGMIRKNQQANYTASVFVTNDIHTGRGTPQPANRLAAILDSGINEKGATMRRTQNSANILDVISIAKGSPTKNWISIADIQMNLGIQKYLNTRMNRNYH